MSYGSRDSLKSRGGPLPRLAGRAAAIALVLAGAGAWGAGWIIGSSVHAAAATALREQPGDRVPALIAYVASPAQTLPARNRAVWALGQMGDARALPSLEQHLTGRDCEHDRALCQRELRKAIRLCRGTPNILAFTWR